MLRYNLWKPSLVCLLIATVAFAGCAQSDTPEPTAPTTPPVSTAPRPAPTTPAPAPTSPAPAPVEPGTAFGPKVYTFGSAPLPADMMTVSTAWRMLRFSYSLNSTAPCFVIQNEPPTPPATATGPSPSLTFVAPSGSSVNFSIPTQNVCGTTPAGPIQGQQGISRDASSEIGEWTVTIRGIGQNVEMRVLVSGS